MKIVYLHQYFRTPEMGGGTRSYEFARRLAKQGHEVHVITSDADAARGMGSRRWRVSEEQGVTVHWAAIPYDNSMSYRRRLWAFGSFAWRAARRAASIDHDVVFATSTPLTIAIPAVHAARRRRSPFVFEVRDVWPETAIALGALRTPLTKWAGHRLEEWAYRRARHVIALSPGMAQSIQGRFPDVAVTVIPNGCDNAMFASATADGAAYRAATPWLGDRPLLLYAGTLGRVNGVDYLVRMAAVLAQTHPEIRVAIVGRGAERERVESLAARLGVLRRNVFLLDQMPKTAIVGLFGACDVALSTVVDQPALHANSANKVFDAWAAGRPVAINHEGWLADIIRQTGCGLVLPAADPQRAAAMIGQFVSDPERLARASQAATMLARGRFDRDALYARFERVLTSVVDADRTIEPERPTPTRRQ